MSDGESTEKYDLTLAINNTRLQVLVVLVLLLASVK